MKAMILAAGVGNRLMPLTADLPKPMIPILNQPLMANVVNRLKLSGISDIIANLHYHGDMISDYFGTGEGFGVRLQYSYEAKLTGTAGGVKLCQPFFDDTFVVISGDGLADIDLTHLVHEHKLRGALASIALKAKDEVEQCGVVLIDDEGRIADFQEKPRRQEAISNLVNTGIYIFEPEIFDFIPKGKFYDFGKQVFPALVKAGASFYGIPVKGYWCDVGSLETYLQAHYDILEGLCHYDACEVRLDRLSDGAKLFIGNSCYIDTQAYLKGRTTIGAGCVIEKNCIINDAVIWDNSVVEQQAIVSGAIIGSKCRIGSNCYLEPGTVVASGCTIAPGTRLTVGSRVFRQNDEQIVIKAG